ncbi:MAG: hypothetical protein ACI8YQ_002058 [Polaribacter sp.]|jgi:hypothetical protein
MRLDLVFMKSTSYDTKAAIRTLEILDYVIDKIDLSTDASSIRVYPAKPDYIMLAEYFRREKKIESRLEKINF